MILGKERCLDTVSKLVNEALRLGAVQAEARLLNFTDYLTRFAGSTIHQNVGENNANLTLKSVLGKRISTVSSSELSSTSIKGLAEKGHKVAKVSGENPEFKSLPEPEPIPDLRALFVTETSECEAEARARMVGDLIKEANSLSACVEEVAGALATSSFEFAVINSLGVQAYCNSTSAELDATVISKDSGSEGFGSASDVSRDIRELNARAVGREAADRSVRSLGAKSIEPGDYEVVLEPYAVGTGLMYAASGLGAQSVQDGTSFMNDLMGKQAFSEELTLWDDGRDLKGLAFPFDSEGVPKRKVLLVEKGIPKAVVYDSYTAHKEGKKSTGHATDGSPRPTHLFVKPGQATKEEMIRETKRGLLVTTLHYVRTVHPKKLVITGMTRDGTWLIEKGEVKYPIKNLRFTESLLRTFENTELVGKEVKRGGRGRMGSMVVPPIKAGVFRFTGTTEY